MELFLIKKSIVTKTIYTYCVYTLLLLLTSCGPSKRLPTFFSGKSDLFPAHFTGFALFDPQTGEYLYKHNFNKFFTPASNTKILTLYTTLQYLEDSMPSLRYVEKSDSIFVWPLGDPVTLHPHFGSNENAIQRLLNKKKSITLCSDHFTEKTYGSGWTWDDHRYAYQAQRSLLPVFGNLFWLTTDTLHNSASIMPNSIMHELTQGDQIEIIRKGPNYFKIEVPDTITENITLRYPLEIDTSFLRDFWERQCGTPLYFNKACKHSGIARTIYSIQIDTVLRYFMHHSDNMIAEQLLLSSSASALDEMNTTMIIDHVKENDLREVADEIHWVDGSGLSRYNMFTPRAVVYVLHRILEQEGFERVSSIFPSGGVSGTVKSWYNGRNNEPYVFAKTGTLRNNHALSGYLKTDSGRVLIFSFFHNHYPGPSSSVKPGMKQVLEYIRDKY